MGAKETEKTQPGSPRDRLVETALALFNEGGYHATGIDKILVAAGVAKMTLYKHFPSKDALILAALALREDRLFAFFDQRIEAAGRDPKARILALFSAHSDWFAGKAFPGAPFRGCMFINAAAEFGGPDDPVREAAARHIAAIRNRLAAEVAALNAPPSLTDTLVLLLEGAIVLAHAGAMPHAGDRAHAAAEQLLAGR